MITRTTLFTGNSTVFVFWAGEGGGGAREGEGAGRGGAREGAGAGGKVRGGKGRGRGAS